MVARIAIVGAGQAGARAAQAMRAARYDGRITLIGEERHDPYERPSLSKAFLTGGQDAVESTILPPGYYAENAIELRTATRVVGIDLCASRLECDSGPDIGFDKLLIATGSRPRMLDVPGAHLPNVFYLRSLNDAQRLRQGLAGCARIAVIGGGFLGLEVAASARALGLEVVVLEREAHLLARVAPRAIGQLVADLHKSRGVDIRCGTAVRHIDGNLQATGVTLRSGEVVPADAVFVAIGGVPNSELGALVGLGTANGIRVNHFGETEAPNVYAAGDVTNHPNRWAEQYVRLESWQVAQNQSVTAARAMCGERHEYHEVPWFWSDQFDVNIQMAGLPGEDDEVFYRGQCGYSKLSAFYYRDKRLTGAIAFNNGIDVRIAQQLINQGGAVDPSRVVDPHVKLKSLLTK